MHVSRKTPASQPHPLSCLAWLPLLAGLVGWLFTADWRWAVTGLAGLVAVSFVLAALAAWQTRREEPR